MSDVAAEFWLKSVEAIQERLSDFAERADDYELREIGQSYRGRPIHMLRIGRGPTKLAIVAAMHGYEVIGTFASLALVHSLLTGRDLDGSDVSGWAAETLSKQSIYLVPMASPDVTARFFKEFPSGHFSDRFSEDASDWQVYYDHMNQPRPYFDRKYPDENHMLGFSEEEMAEWNESGRHLGLRWTEAGIDPWKDWLTFHIPETRALRDFLVELQSQCVFEIHNQGLPSSIFLPIPSARGEAAQKQLEYGEAIHIAARESGLPYTRHSMHTYQYSEHGMEFPDWALRELGCLVLWGELGTGFFNDSSREKQRQSLHHYLDADASTPSDEDLIKVGWIWLRRTTELGNERGYR